MTCAGQPAEEYQLYALGILEETDREQIRTHLAQGCETCLAGVRQGNRFWSVFGVGSALLTLVTPPARLRRKILAAVTPSQPSWLGLFWLSGKQVAGIAALLMLTATGTWFITRQPARIQPVPETRTITEVRPDPAQQQEIERLTQQLDAARRAAPGTAPAAAVTALERELAQARSSAGDAGQALTQERARATQTEAQLREQIRVQTTQLDAVNRERQDLERRYQAVVDDRARLQEREKLLVSYTNRIQQLERENAQIRAVLDTQQKNLDQSTRLVAFLSSPSINFVKLRSTQTGKGAEAHAFVAEGSRVVFYASNLPALAPGRVYQLWLIRDRAPAVVSGGVFQLTGAQQVVEFSNGNIVRGIRGLAVTDEPTGGSPLPTGPKFLVGSSRS